MLEQQTPSLSMLLPPVAGPCYLTLAAQLQSLFRSGKIHKRARLEHPNSQPALPMPGGRMYTLPVVWRACSAALSNSIRIAGSFGPHARAFIELFWSEKALKSPASICQSVQLPGCCDPLPAATNGEQTLCSVRCSPGQRLIRCMSPEWCHSFSCIDACIWH